MWVVLGMLCQDGEDMCCSQPRDVGSTWCYIPGWFESQKEAIAYANDSNRWNEQLTWRPTVGRYFVIHHSELPLFGLDGHVPLS